MSEYQVLAIIAGFAFLYSLVASRLERTPVSGATVYIVCGMLFGPYGLNVVDFQVDGEGIKRLAELSLAVCLFTDSANVKLRVLRRIEAIPLRLLLVGLPLTIAAGWGAGLLIFNNLGVFEVALLASMLAPTDAALGKAVVTNPAVPDQVRESLNVESGLNDGICVPVVLLLLAMAAESVQAGDVRVMMLRVPLQVIGIGMLVGLLLAVVGGFALRTCRNSGWVAGTWLQVPIIALALLSFGLAQWLGGSGFIACYVGGLLFGGLTRQHKDDLLHAAEGAGDALALVTWFVFGTIMTTLLFRRLSWPPIAYAVLSLTVIRMLPVALCLAGKGLKTDSLLFIGWFGPRGMASIVFAVMVADSDLPEIDSLVTTVSWTIVLSILAHGITANPLANAYGNRVQARRGVI